MNDTMHSPECARKLRSLADADRLRIVQCLRDGPKNVTEIADELNLLHVNVSHHLRVLRQAQVLLDEKHGRFMVYRLNPEVYEPAESKKTTDHLNLGCCRLE